MLRFLNVDLRFVAVYLVSEQDIQFELAGDVSPSGLKLP